MKNPFQNHQVTGIPVIKSAACTVIKRSPMGFLPKPDTQLHISKDHDPTNGSSGFRKTKADSLFKTMNKLGKKADSFANGVRDHVRLAPKISETVKGKLSLGAKILQVGGVEKIFKHLFIVREDEKLLKASQCYLSTTAGPIAGLLFISTNKVAFCSERSLKLSSPNGKSIKVHYKVLIPLEKIKRVNQSENLKKPGQKYMQIVTIEDFEFWFMGFLNYQKAFKYLQQAISLNQND